MPPVDPDPREIRWDRLRASIAGAQGPPASRPDQGPRHALPDDLTGLVRALVVVVAVAVAIAGVLFWRASPREVQGESSQGASLGRPDAEQVGEGSQAPNPSATGAGDAAAIVVHVVGRVRRPGVVRLPPGARVADAVRAAGGLRAGTDPTAVNLARPLSDGEQLVIAPAIAPDKGGGSGAAAMPSGGAAPGGDGRLDLNQATADQLEELDGIGPVLAERIVEYRQAQGRFATVDDLREVSGIGPKIFAALSSQVRV